MKKTTHTLVNGSLLAACGLFAGCLSVQKFHYENAPLKPVRFESLEAQQTFYQALIVHLYPGEGPRYSITASITLPLWIENQTVQSGNVMVNEALEKTDTNHDGLITGEEAKAYADALAAQKEKDASEKPATP